MVGFCLKTPSYLQQTVELDLWGTEGARHHALRLGREGETDLVKRGTQGVGSGREDVVME